MTCACGACVCGECAYCVEPWLGHALERATARGGTNMLAQRALTRRHQRLRVRARARVGGRASPSEHDSDWSSAFDGRAPGTRPRGSSREKEGGGGVLLGRRERVGLFVYPLLAVFLRPALAAPVSHTNKPIFLAFRDSALRTTARAPCVASSASVRWTCTKTCRSCVRTGTRSWCSRTKVATSSAFPSWMMKAPRHVSRTPCALLLARGALFPSYPLAR